MSASALETAKFKSAWDEAVDIVERHRRQIESSPGIGKETQKYAFVLCFDIAQDLRMAQYRRKRK